MVDYKERYEKWINREDLNSELLKELEEIKDNDSAIEERFYKSLEFGTAGLRGIIGAGTNRMNIYTVRKATLGLANFLNQNFEGSKKVVIAYDSRFKSQEFAKQAGLVLANNGIEACIFKDITATPLLSYAVCEMKATAGIVITASHNPKEYNGYKVYCNYGGQITDDDAHQITAEIEKITDELDVQVMDEALATEKKLLVWIHDEILNKYIKKTEALILNKNVIKKMGHDLNIVYTPLHGTGNVPVSIILKKSGFKNLDVVREQAVPDPSFPTVKYPNPEEKKAFSLALKLAEKKNADLILGTDPDADRVGVIVKNEKGEYVDLNGNQLGALLIDYILSNRKEKNKIPENGVIIKTIVTSSMGVDIARKYGVGHLDLLTGFKYIGEKIAEFEKNNEHTFLFGYEESYGFLIGDYVRDKDAVQICLLASEMAAYYKDKGLTLFERLQELFKEFGYYKESLENIKLEGIEGQKTINKIIDNFRNDAPEEIGDNKVLIICDYLEGTEKDMVTGEENKTTLPKSNVLRYRLADGSWFCVRPSGTEPKLKIYFGVKADTENEASSKLNSLKEIVMKKVESSK